MMRSKRFKNKLPKLLRNSIDLFIAFKNRNNQYYKQISSLPVCSSGLSDDATPYIKLNNGLIFYGFLPSNAQKYLYRYFIDKNIKSKIMEETFGVAYDISMRYWGPPIKENPVGQGKYYELNKGEVVVEVGAFMGYYAIRASELVGKEGVVIVIEAIEENYEILKKNIEANSIQNIKIVPKAVWKDKGTLKFFRTCRQQASAIHNTVEKMEETLVPCDTLDNILESLNIIRPNFIRIQVNGAELEVLEGMKKTLTKYPKLLIAAIYEREGQKSWKIIEAILCNKGFRTLTRNANVFAWKENEE